MIAQTVEIERRQQTSEKQRLKQKKIKQIIEMRKTVRFLMSSGNFTRNKAKKIARTVPSIASMTKPPFPVRITELNYPDNFISITDDERFKTIQSFILDAVQRRNAPPIVDFICISGYIIVLTVHRGSQQFVRSLMGELWNLGTRLREPTFEQVEQFLDKRYSSGLMRPKPTKRCTKDAKNWREYLTGQRIPYSETEDSDGDE